METLVKHKFYEIAVNKAKNRLCLTIIGFWRSPQEVSSYVKDLEQALKGISGKFTLLVDLTKMITHPKEVQPIHLQAQQLLLSKGLMQTAEVYASSFVQFQTTALSKQSKMPLRQFTSLLEAELYLDSVKN